MTGLGDARLDETGNLPDAPAREASHAPSTGGGVVGDEGPLPEIGAVIGNYRLLEVIGAGGMGRVYKAEHTLLGKKVALKMLRRRYAESPEAVQRFFSEARAVTRIEHENLVDVTDFLDAPEWPPAFVMQLLRGRSLASAIREDGPFTVQRLLSVGVQTSSAVAAVHGASIIHRDLKPANIFLAQHRGGGEVVKLLDFGVAKLLDEQGISLNETSAATPIGTPDYMAPEQVTGSTKVDHRVDIWALGAVLYEAATGRLPFKASSFGDLVLQLVSKDVIPPNELRQEHEPLPRSLELFIVQCLNRVPAQRPSSMHEIYERLLALATPYAIPNLEGSGYSLAETDPGLSRPSSSDSGTSRIERVAPSEDGDTLPDAGPPTGDLIGELRRPSLRMAAGIAGGLLIATLAVVSLLGGEEPPVEPAPIQQAETPPVTTTKDELIKLSFTSTPSGSKVFYEGADVELGATPFELEVPRGQDPLRFEVRLQGHVPATALVTPDQAQRIQLTLSPASPTEKPPIKKDRGRKETPGAKKAPESKKAADKEGLIQVF